MTESTSESQIDRLLERALDLPPAEREQFLQQIGATDQPLRARLDKLLALAEQDDGFLEHSPLRAEAPAGTEDQLQPFDPILAKALKKHPKDRYETVEAFREDLNRHRKVPTTMGSLLVTPSEPISPTPATGRRAKTTGNRNTQRPKAGTSNRKLAAIVFTDIVGYSKLVNADERQARHLLEMHRKLIRRNVTLYGGREIDSAGDGFLVIFDSALIATECAVAIQDQLHQRNQSVPAEEQLRLRIGIHLGDVERNKGKVFGDGVNVGARLEPLSPTGGIAVSAPVIAQIHGPLRGHFRSTGPQVLKNIPQPLEIFHLEEQNIPSAAELLLTPKSRRLRKLLPATAAAALIALLIAGGFYGQRLIPNLQDDASVAVLPLENLSTEEHSAEFVAGLHDSLLTEISKIPKLKVISRTSVMRYAKDRPPLPEIAKVLNVSNILEGSVQRQGRHIRINVQLIKASTDEHIWASTYDRDVNDLFAIQTEISKEVSRKIQGKLVTALPKSERPTNNVEAYDLYLRADSRLADIEISGNISVNKEPLEETIRLFEQAVALDPKFALAWAGLARANYQGVIWAINADMTRKPEFDEALKRAAQIAYTLDRTLPESLYAMALVAQLSYDFSKDEAYLKQALELLPSFAPALADLADAYGRRGHLDLEEKSLRTLLDFDPVNESGFFELSVRLVRQKRFADAHTLMARWSAITQTPVLVKFFSGQIHFDETGDLAPLKAAVATGSDDESGAVHWPPYGVNGMARDARAQIALYERRYADAIAPYQHSADEFADKNRGEDSAAMFVARALVFSGDRVRAEHYLKPLLAHFRSMPGVTPENPHGDWNTIYLSEVEDMLGDYEAAMNHAWRVAQLRDPAGPQPGSWSYQAAIVDYTHAAAHAGKKKEALDKLDWLLDQPYDVQAHDVLLDPVWAPLNKDPDFHALVRKHLPKT